MNNKVSKFQIGMLLSLICSRMYLGISDVVLLKKSNNEVLVSMIIGVIIGLIPVLMYLKINNTFPNLNIYEKNKKLFGNKIGYLFNFLILIVYMMMLTISVRAIVIFVTSKYLQFTPFILVGTLVIITSIIICFKGIETVARISQISFWASLILMITIELLLFKYIEIRNILPIFEGKNHINNIIQGSLYYASTCGLLTFLLLTINKTKVKDEKNYNKTIILFYLVGSLSLVIVMFFVVSCFGYKMGSIFRYPEYILLKKIGISNSELHLENLLAFRWIFYILALVNISLYGILTGIKNFIKNIKISKIMIVLISFFCMYIGKIIFGDIPHSILIIEKFYLPFIALPIFIIFLIIFIKCFFSKNKI